MSNGVENGISYTYLTDENRLYGGFVSIDEDSFAYYDESPYLEIVTYGVRVEFLFLYNDSTTSERIVHILHVLDRETSSTLVD